MVEVYIHRPNKYDVLSIQRIATKLGINKTTIYSFIDRPEFREFEVGGPYRRFLVNEDFKNALREAMRKKWSKLKDKKDCYKMVDLL